jgi:hypothetical protein
MAETDFPVGWPRQRPDDLRYGMKARQRRRRFLAAPYSARQPARVSRVTVTVIRDLRKGGQRHSTPS